MMKNPQRILLILSWVSNLSTVETEKYTARLDSSWLQFPNRLMRAALPQRYTTVSKALERVWGMNKVNTLGCRVGWGGVEPPDKRPCGVISPPTPPPGNLTWNIGVHPLYHVNVTLLGFNLTPSIVGCRVESLDITWSNGHMTPRCGSRLPWSVYVPGKEVAIHYTTEGGPRGGKFIVHYQVYKHGAIKGQLETYMYNIKDVQGKKFPKYPVNISHAVFQEFYNGRRSILIIRERFYHFIQAKVILERNRNCYFIEGHDGPFPGSPNLALIHANVNETNIIFGRSSGFVIAFQVEIFHQTHCNDVNGLTIQYTRLKLHQYYASLPQNNAASFVSDGCQYRNMRLCLFSTKYSKHSNWNVTLTKVQLNGFDTSRHCLYEALVIYPGLLIRNVKEYPVILCQKIRQYQNGNYFEDYVINSFVNMADGITIIYYSYYTDAPSGEIIFNLSSTTATGVFAYCRKPRLSPYAYTPYREDKFSAEREDSRLGAQLRPFGWVSTEGETYFGYGAHVSRGYNGSMCLNVISVLGDAVIQYYPTSYPAKPLQSCAVAVLQSREVGVNNLKFHLTHRVEAAAACNVSIAITEWELSNEFHPYKPYKFYSEAFIIENIDSACFSFSLNVTAQTTASGNFRTVNKPEITTSDISALFLRKKKHHISSNIRNLNHRIRLTIASLENNTHFGIAHSTLSIHNSHVYPHLFLRSTDIVGLRQAEIKLWGEGCTVTVRLTIFYLLLEQQWLSYALVRAPNFHKFTISGLISPTKWLKFYQYHYHINRFIFVKPTKVITRAQSECAIRLTIKNELFIYDKTSSLLLGTFDHTYTHKPPTLPKIHDVAEWYMLWLWKPVTWQEADAKCQSIDAQLPMIKFQQDFDTLRNLLWGSYRYNHEYVKADPCRVYNPLCHFFVGLYPNQVRYSGCIL